MSSEPHVDDTECEHAIERAHCVFCSPTYAGKDVRDGFCPACNNGAQPPVTSTWHVVAGETSTCVACGHEHPYLPGWLELRSI